MIVIELEREGSLGLGEVESCLVQQLILLRVMQASSWRL